VRNFSWNLFRPLMEGGEISFRGKTFFIDKNLSNPKNFGYPEYFTTDAIKEISVKIKAQWPQEYVSEVERFESFANVSARMAGTLRRLKNLRDKNYRIILVTHDAMTGALVKTFTSGQSSGVDPAQFVSVERAGDKFVVTSVGNRMEGDRETNSVP